MARRIIRTVDGQIFSDSSSRFENRKGFVLYRKGALNTVRINNRGITSDDISGLPASVLMVMGIIVVIGLIVVVLFFGNNAEVGEARQGNANFTQHNANITQNAPLIIGSTKSKRYYLYECPGYGQVKPEHQVSFKSEREAINAGYIKSKQCPR